MNQALVNLEKEYAAWITSVQALTRAQRDNKGEAVLKFWIGVVVKHRENVSHLVDVAANANHKGRPCDKPTRAQCLFCGGA